MHNLILFLEKVGLLTTYFFIFCILSNMIAPFLGFSYGKFYDFVDKQSKKIYRLVQKIIGYQYTRFIPFISLVILYFINDLFFTSYYKYGSGVYCLLNLDFIDFLLIVIKVVLELSNSFLNFFLFVFIIKFILNFTSYKYSVFYNLLSSITGSLVVKSRKYLLKLNLKNHEDLFIISFLLIIKIIILSLHKNLL